MRVLVEGCLVSQVAPETALLIAAEGGCGVVLVVRVDPDGSCLDLLGDAVGLADVAGPDAGGEAVDGVVRCMDGVVDVLLIAHIMELLILCNYVYM